MTVAFFIPMGRENILSNEGRFFHLFSLDIGIALVHRSPKLHPMIFFHRIVPLKVLVFMQDGQGIFLRIHDDVIHPTSHLLSSSMVEIFTG